MSDARPVGNVEYGSRRPLRRRAVLKVDSRVLADLLQLPGDVHVVMVAPDPMRDALCFMLESERFEETLEGGDPREIHGILTADLLEGGLKRYRVTWPELE